VGRNDEQKPDINIHVHSEIMETTVTTETEQAIMAEELYKDKYEIQDIKRNTVFELLIVLCCLKVTRYLIHTFINVVGIFLKSLNV
jgi:hypothetical protein